jgi:MFS superfamily sulfate permease-like transporter
MSYLRVAHFGKDMVAGVVVFLIALPLCLGIALASGAPIVAGILSGIIGGIVVGVLSGSATSVSGPAAGLTTIISAHILALGSFEAFLSALVIAGLLQIAMGALRLGFVADFFPTSVIKGLLAAIGFILILKQLPHLVGLDKDFEGDMAFMQHNHETTFTALGDMLYHVHEGALLIGIISLGLMILWGRVRILKSSIIPAPLVIAITGTLFTLAFARLGGPWSIGDEHRVAVPVIGAWQDFSNIFTFPDLSRFVDVQVWIAGMSLALVASLETLLNIEAVDKLDPKQRKSPPNRELLAQGVGNFLLGLIGGLPTTSVIVRGSVNINAGARTKAATIIHGFLLLICVVTLPLVLNEIPLSCLAAILIITGYKLSSPRIVRDMWRQGYDQFLPFLATFTAIVFTDLLTGVMIGLGVGLLFILKRNLNGPIRLVKEHHVSGELHRVILGNQVSFLNRASLTKTLKSVPENSHLVIDASDSDYIDSDVLDLIKDYQSEFATVRNIDVSSVGFKEQYAFDAAYQFVDHSTIDVQRTMSPDQALLLLKQGNERARTNQRVRRDLSKQIEATSVGQFPFAVVLSCIDSRVPVELTFDLGIGDVFSIRMAGNVISERVIGSMEFACSIAGAKLIVVMGHTRCGAVSAAFDAHRDGTSSYEAKGLYHLATIINDIQRVIHRVDGFDFNKRSRENCENRIIRENIHQSMYHIRQQSSVLAKLLDDKQIGMVGCIYDVSNGSVEFIDESPHDEAPNFAHSSTLIQA